MDTVGRMSTLLQPRPQAEGLAQYYARAVCARLGELAPDSVKAFDRLLAHQPDVYGTHQEWGEFEPEEVRLAMIQTRRSGPGRATAFADSLAKARAHLRTQEL